MNECKPLDAGANFKLKCERGMTAADYAHKRAGGLADSARVQGLTLVTVAAHLSCFGH